MLLRRGTGAVCLIRSIQWLMHIMARRGFLLAGGAAATAEQKLLLDKVLVLLIHERARLVWASMSYMRFFKPHTLADQLWGGRLGAIKMHGQRGGELQLSMARRAVTPC